MMFDLSPEQQAARDAAAAFARDRLAPAAAAIDESATIGRELIGELQNVSSAASQDPVALVTVIEELATVSAAAAAVGALPSKTSDTSASGLRGFGGSAATDARSRLVIAAAALGIARAAVNIALANLRDSARKSQDQEKPHWAVADAATEVAAARMLTLHAAQSMADEEAAAGVVAMAKLAATRAAQQAVDVALRIVGPEGFARGTLLEKLARDARTVALIFGTEEDLRAAAANAVLPG